ncbi:hypothetical protein KUL156_04170 [Alteromonas sp. KUL156]|nr:hypothetical protein KUL154_06000 [Alteromonas sp. KUL154]GFD97824.1 hypothetical protein KUL156_04170 [Alteromonas sp. KUL156]
MEQIVAREERFTKDFSSHPLPPLFISQGCEESKFKTEWLTPSTDEAVKDLLNGSRQTLFISTNALEEKYVDIIRKNVDEKDLRVYLCLGDKKKNTSVIAKLKDRCFIRYGVAQVGSLWISDCNTLNARGSINLGGYQATLNKSQLDDSYRSFCYLFWNSATHEISEGEESKVASFDTKIVTNHDFHQAHKLNDHLKCDTAEFLCQTKRTTDLQLSTALQAKVIASRKLNQLVSSSIEKQLHVALAERNLPTISAGNNKIWLLPDEANSNSVNWALELNGQQALELKTSLEELIASMKWQLSYETTVENIVGKAILYPDSLNSEPLTCKENISTELKDFICDSFEEFLDAEPSTLVCSQTGFQKNNIAKSVQYDVRIHPPYLPKGAVQAELVEQWGRADKQWHAAINTLRAKIESLESTFDELKKGPLIGKLKQFLLGQNRAVKENTGNLRELSSFLPSSSSPADREEKMALLKKVGFDISRRKKDTEAEKQKAKALKQWEEKQESLLAKLRESEDAYEKSVSRKEQQTIEIKKKKDLVKSQAQEKLQSFNEKNEQYENTPSNFEELSKLIKTSKAAKKWPGELKSLINNANSQLNQLSKSLETLADKVEQSKRNVVSCKQALEDHKSENTISKEPSDHFDKQLGIKEDQSLNINWPSAELPANNLKLFSANNKLYLVVYFQEHIEQARKDAVRLGAALCIKREQEKENA